MCPLNEHCLLLFFDTLPLQELLHLRSICHYWKYLIESNRCRRLKSLKLFASKKDISSYAENLAKHKLDGQLQFRLKSSGEDDSLILQRGPEDASSCAFLVALFPNVELLAIYSQDYEFCKYTDLSCLLVSWGDKLKALIIDYEHWKLLQLATKLWSASINNLPNLESLYVLSKAKDNIIPSVEPLVGNLKHFSMGLIEYPNYKIFTKMDPLKMSELRFTVAALDNVLQALTHFERDPARPRSLTSLFVHIFNLDADVLEKATFVLRHICQTYTSLETIFLDFLRAIPLDIIFRELAKLEHLEELYLDARRFGWFSPSLYRLPRLRRIKVLHLTYYFALYRLDRLGEALDYLFPNLEHLLIDAGHHDDIKDIFDIVISRLPNCKLTIRKYKANFQADLSYIEGRYADPEH